MGSVLTLGASYAASTLQVDRRADLELPSLAFPEAV